MADTLLARPDLAGTFGMASSTHWIASAVAMGVLERAGNAFDAAVAAGLTLWVAEPHLNGPGGEVPIILHAASAGPDHVEVICGQGPAPAAATPATFAALGLDLVPGTGLLAAAVPGAFDAWMVLLRDRGTIGLAEAMAPAIHYAGSGIPLPARAHATIAQVVDLFRKDWPSSAELWLPGGAPPDPDAPFVYPELARTLQRLCNEAQVAIGREAQIDRARLLWREGFVAEAIDRFTRSVSVPDVSGRSHTGLLTGADMARFEARVERPVSVAYRDVEVFKCGPWSQGPTFLQTLRLLAGFDLDATAADGPEFVHLLTEAMKLAFADRDAWLGDPDFVDVPLATLLDPGYAASRRTLIAETASLAHRPGVIDGRPGWVPPGAEARGAKAPEFAAGTGFGEPTVRRDGATGGDTCHIDVVDRWGNMVAAMPSGGWLQSSPTIPGLGFCLGTRLQMCWLDPAAPSVLAPGKRPRTTLTPSLAFRDGKPWLAFGTPGGDQQEQWQLQFLLRVLHHKLTLQQAIEAPTFTAEHWPNSFWPRAAKPGRLVVEARFPDATQAELRRRGHDLEVTGAWALGRMCAVAREGKLLRAAANPRGQQGYAVGR